jgi:hypothetical protein
VTQGKIKILKIDTALHPADQLTKPVPEDVLRRHRKTVQGWDTDIPCRYTSTRGSKGKPTTDGNLENYLPEEFDNQSTSTVPTRNPSVSDAVKQGPNKSESQIPKSLRNLGDGKIAMRDGTGNQALSSKFNKTRKENLENSFYGAKS